MFRRFVVIPGLTLASLVLAVALVIAVVWTLPWFLTDPLIDGVSNTDHLKALSDTRASLVTVLVAIGAVGAAVVGVRNYRLARAVHFNDRYKEVVEMLNSPKESIRIGAIYSLSGLSNSSKDTRFGVTQVLASFVSEECKSRDQEDEACLARDMQLAIWVLARPWLRSSLTHVSLRDSRLARCSLVGLQFDRMSFEGADLSYSTLEGARFSQCNLTNTDLRGANVAGAKFPRCSVKGLDLRGADGLSDTLRRDLKSKGAQV